MNYKAIIRGPYKKNCPYGHDRLKDKALDISGGCIVCKNNRDKKYKKNYISKGLCITGCGRILFTKVKCRFCNSKELKRNKILIKNLHSLVIKEYGNKCNCCGEGASWTLQIDHIANNGNIQRKFVKGISFYNYILGCYPKDIQILCANCNYGKRMRGGKCPHKN